MFGQKTTFGAPASTGGFGTFGSTTTSSPFGATGSAFGQPQQQQQQQQAPAFGVSAFGAAPGAGGSLFGAPATTGLFGSSTQPATSATSFGGFGSSNSS